MFNPDVPAFVPHRWLANGHAQTVFATLYPGIDKKPGATRHVICLPDGDQLALHESRPAGGPLPSRYALLLHGLGGCHGSGYMIRTAVRLVENGVGCWRLDQRGCGAGASMARWHHHAGRTADLQAAVQQIMRLHPRCRLTAVGYSLGANLLLSWLAEYGQSPLSPVDSAIAIAPPIDLMRCSRNLQTGLNRGYDLYFANLLRQRLIERRKLVPGLADVDINPLPRSLYEFDDRFTAPLGGFADAREYYSRCSAAPKLRSIRTPTLIVADRSDPVVPFDIFERWPRSKHVQLLTTRGGGHLGYLNDVPHERRWMDIRVTDWIGRLV